MSLDQIESTIPQADSIGNGTALVFYPDARGSKKLEDALLQCGITPTLKKKKEHFFTACEQHQYTLIIWKLSKASPKLLEELHKIPEHFPVILLAGTQELAAIPKDFTRENTFLLRSSFHINELRLALENLSSVVFSSRPSLPTSPHNHVFDEDPGFHVVVANYYRQALLERVRHPLNTILGFSEESLRSTTSVQEFSDSMRAIQGNAEELSFLVEEFQDIAELESNTFCVNLKPTLVRKIVDRLAAQFGSTAKGKGVEFLTQIRGNVPVWVNADSDRIYRLLYRLVEHAIYSTDKGYVQIELDYSDSNEELIIRVSDSSKGMEEESLQHLFDPLYQVREKGQNSVHGLGLSLAQSIASKLGGRIAVESKNDVGTTFEVFLNCSPIRNLDEAQELGSKLVEAEQLGGKALLVSENHHEQELLRLHLKHTQVELETVCTGQQALCTLEEAEFDLILIDLSLQGMNGLKLARAIREQGNKTPLVALTAARSQEVEKAICRVGYKNQLTRPVHFRALLSVLSDNLPTVEPLLSSQDIREKSSFKRNSQDDSCFKLESAIANTSPDLQEAFHLFVSSLPGNMKIARQATLDKNEEELNSVLYELLGSAALFGLHSFTSLLDRALAGVSEQDFSLVQHCLEELDKFRASNSPIAETPPITGERSEKLSESDYEKDSSSVSQQAAITAFKEKLTEIEILVKKKAWKEVFAHIAELRDGSLLESLGSFAEEILLLEVLAGSEDIDQSLLALETAQVVLDELARQLEFEEEEPPSSEILPDNQIEEEPEKNFNEKFADRLSDLRKALKGFEWDKLAILAGEASSFAMEQGYEALGEQLLIIEVLSPIESYEEVKDLLESMQEEFLGT